MLFIDLAASHGGLQHRLSEVLPEMSADAGFQPVAGTPWPVAGNEADMTAGRREFQRGRRAEHLPGRNRCGRQEGVILRMDDEGGCDDAAQEGPAAGAVVIIVDVPEAVERGGNGIVELPEGLQRTELRR